jgi:Ca2+-dependent lipid-binding protein
VVFLVSYADNSANVTWNEDFEIVVDSAEHGKIKFILQDLSAPTPATLGVYVLDIAALPVEKVVDQWVDLDRNLGKLRLRLTFNPSTVSAEEKQTRTRRITQLTLTLAKTELMAHETVEGSVTLQLGSSLKVESPIEVTFKGYVCR